MTERPIRIVVAKPGLDGHDRGAKVVARALRDAGHRGHLHRPAPDARADRRDRHPGGRRRRRPVGALRRAHDAVRQGHRAAQASATPRDIVVFGGGIIPEDDIPELEELGVAKVFTPGATTTEIVDWVREHVRQLPGPT